MSGIKYSAIARDENGDIAIPFRLVHGREAVAQRLATRFRFFKGEWFLDRRLGTPYFSHILGKVADKRVIRQILRDIVLRCPGIQSVERFEVTFDRVNRRYELDFEVTCGDGSPFRSQPREFVVKVID